jgi:hypothetical protein
MHDAQDTDERDDSGGYDLAPDQASKPPFSATPPAARARPAATPAPQRAPAQKPLLDSADESADADALDADTEGSLAPPISREANPQLWLVVAGVCLALISISFLAGAPQLSLPVPTEEGTRVPELGFLERVVGIARTVVYMPLATLAAVFGILCLAFVRQRPVGDVAAMFAKCAAIVGVGMLVWLVPSDIRIVKQLLNVLGAPILAGAMSVPLFRLSPRDAAVATMCSVVGMMLLVLTAMVVVWATGA